MDKALAESVFELLCERMEIDPEEFKKKHDGMASTGRGKKRKDLRSKRREAVLQGGDDPAELLQAEGERKRREWTKGCGRPGNESGDSSRGLVGGSCIVDSAMSSWRLESKLDATGCSRCYGKTTCFWSRFRSHLGRQTPGIHYRFS